MTDPLRLPLLLVLSSLLLSLCGLPAFALTPDQLVIVTNKAVPESSELAHYYMKKRGVPPGNLVAVTTSKDEGMSREEYDRQIASPVRDFLKKIDPQAAKIRCLVVMYGIPLRVAPPALSPEEQKQLAVLKERRAAVLDQMKAAEQAGKKPPDKALQDENSALLKKIQQVSRSNQGASVDSEIGLVLEKVYTLEGWLPSRYFVGFQGKDIPSMPRNALLVARLDGPAPETVKRIIDDSLEAERTGLTGKAYFDARWPDKGEKNVAGYQLYDGAIHNAARIARESRKVTVVLDEQERLFQPGEAPDAALYCGWYSLGKYVDAFTWVKGSVGYHIASAECTTLKRKGSTVWCKMMLEKGVAATVGPVAEPYVQAFPLPDIFFGCLLSGRATLAECYGAATPFSSWQMVLIGDPLYRPFKQGAATNKE